MAKKILAIDGGGIRGVIPCVVLAEIERRAERPIGELFDLIVGTSTGGIIALGLTVQAPDGGRRYRAQELLELHLREGGQIFRRPRPLPVRMFRPKYSSKGLRRFLTDALGDARLSEASPEVVVVAYETEIQVTWFFRSVRAKEDRTYDFTMVDVALATSAAPTYFAPHTPASLGTDRPGWTFVDGGIFANNPALVALAEVRSAGRDEQHTVVSVGTGEEVAAMLPHAQIKRWGLVRWAPSLVGMVFSAGSTAVEYQAGTLVGDTYIRLQGRLGGDANSRLDDASPKNLKALEVVGRRLVIENSRAIDEVCTRLLTS